MELNDRLRAARAAIGKTQQQVAIEAGMNVTQYNGYERARSRPTPATLQRLAAALHTTPETLLSEPGVTPPPAMPDPDRISAIRNLRARFRDQLAAQLGLDPEEVSIRIEIL